MHHRQHTDAIYCVRSDGEKFNCNFSVVQAGVCVCVCVCVWVDVCVCVCECVCMCVRVCVRVVGGGGQHSVCEFLLCHFCDSMCSGGTHADLD